MIKRILTFLLIALCSFVITGCHQYQYDAFSSIEGIVIDKNSSPIEGAKVTLSPTGLNVITGVEGTFLFEGLENTKYTVTAQKTGYSTDRKEISMFAGEKMNITLVLRK